MSTTAAERGPPGGAAAFNMNAAPFIPGKPNSTGGTLAEAVKAQPFVPGGPVKGAKASAPAGPNQQSGAAKSLTVSAPAFVPGGKQQGQSKRGQEEGETTTSSSSPAGSSNNNNAAAGRGGGRAAGGAAQGRGRGTQASNASLAAAAGAPATPAGAAAAASCGGTASAAASPATATSAASGSAAAAAGSSPAASSTTTATTPASGTTTTTGTAIRGSPATPGGRGSGSGLGGRGGGGSAMGLSGPGGGRGGDGGRGGGRGRGGGGGHFMGGPHPHMPGAHMTHIGGPMGSPLHHMMGPPPGAMHMHGHMGHMVGAMGPPLPMVVGGGPSAVPLYRPHEQYMVGPGRASMSIHFVEEGVRQQLAHRAYLIAAQWPADSEEGSLPERCGGYHSLYPLEPLNQAAAGGSSTSDAPSAALGVRSLVVKGVAAKDGQPAALRRIDAKQVIPTADLLSRARAAVDAWTPLANHPHLVGLRGAFVSAEFDGSGALVFAHDLHPGAVTLAAAHLMPQVSHAGLVSAPQPPAEEVLWSYLVQITAAMRACHSAGLPLRTANLHPTKVLLTGFGRLRVGACLGIPDALSGDVTLPTSPPPPPPGSSGTNTAAGGSGSGAGGSNAASGGASSGSAAAGGGSGGSGGAAGAGGAGSSGGAAGAGAASGGGGGGGAGAVQAQDREHVAMLMRADLAALGQLLLVLACAGLGPPHLELMACHYTPELTRLVGALLSAGDPSTAMAMGATPPGHGGPHSHGPHALTSVRQLAASLADRAFGELEAANLATDNMVTDLAKECENGRLLRLLAKMCFVTERPEGDVDASWSETGDRYVVKLFRDYVFHQSAPPAPGQVPQQGPDGAPKPHVGGGPLLDWGHVVECLNKLDAGVPEEVLLMSRDEQSMLVVAYADIKRCLESSFMELKALSQQAQPVSGSRLGMVTGRGRQ